MAGMAEKLAIMVANLWSRPNEHFVKRILSYVDSKPT